MKYRVDKVGAIIFDPIPDAEKQEESLLEKIEKLEERVKKLEKVVEDGKLQSK